MKKMKSKLCCCLLVCSMMIGMCGTGSSAQAKSTAKLDKKYANISVDWGLGLNAKHKTPGGEAPYHGFSLKKYRALYHGNTKQKIIYLSFDCGYENGNTKKILKTLKKNHVKAIFFVTMDYLEENPKLVKQMKRQGHLVGSHTSTHPRLSGCSKKKISKEVRSLERLMWEKTGYPLDKFIRPPEGNYSIRALKILQELGYTTVFWSLAWYDYNVNDQPSASYVVSRFKKYYHKGMLPLMHVVSSADTKALPQVISYMKSKGYTFETVDTISLK